MSTTIVQQKRKGRPKKYIKEELGEEFKDKTQKQISGEMWRRKHWEYHKIDMRIRAYKDRYGKDAEPPVEFLEAEFADARCFPPRKKE